MLLLKERSPQKELPDIPGKTARQGNHPLEKRSSGLKEWL